MTDIFISITSIVLGASFIGYAASIWLTYFDTPSVEDWETHHYQLVSLASLGSMLTLFGLYKLAVVAL